jgi:hypothetical protein
LDALQVAHTARETARSQVTRQMSMRSNMLFAVPSLCNRSRCYLC